MRSVAAGNPLRVLVELIQQLLQRLGRAAAEMDGRRLLAHQPQQCRRESEPLVARVLGHFDLRDVRRERTNEPLVVHLKNGSGLRIACWSKVAVREAMQCPPAYQYCADGTSALASRASRTPFLLGVTAV
jgi:hypothetical protein